MIKTIKVWCEYDFGGNFGGNNNEEIYQIEGDCKSIDELVLTRLSRITGLEGEALEGLYNWEYVCVELLT